MQVFFRKLPIIVLLILVLGVMAVSYYKTLLLNNVSIVEFEESEKDAADASEL